MTIQMLHTPDGVRDIYRDEYDRKHVLEERIDQTMKSFGYHPIQTPTFEYFDIFGSEIGTTPSQDLYKFLDRDGNTLALRPDFTPSIARCAAKYYMDDNIPVRFCYNGSTFTNSSSYQGYLRETTQSGAEMIGDGSVSADAEMIALIVEILRSAGLHEFQVSVGHVDFLKGLFEVSHLGEEVEEKIRTLLLNRNFYGVEDLIASSGLNDDLIWLFGLLKDVMLTKDKLQEAGKRAEAYPMISAALRRLEQLEDLLRVYGVEQYVFYEMAMVPKLHYYTGIIFSAYTFGSGEAVVKGGRYDNLLSAFGKSAPAIGFAVVIENLLNALQRQNIRIPCEDDTIWIVYCPERQADAIAEAKKMRENGESVELMLLDETNTKDIYQRYAEQYRVSEIRFYTGEEA
ncbi:MAG: ATP phosphoribosyltransferase regulatory subunit [Lachnospiraceae bacterium]|nr:ATP phosphoribosyltransferase regulatory subunit [Lachnospiraceae bacterium]